MDVAVWPHLFNNYAFIFQTINVLVDNNSDLYLRAFVIIKVRVRPKTA